MHTSQPFALNTCLAAAQSSQSDRVSISSRRTARSHSCSQETKGCAAGNSRVADVAPTLATSVRVSSVPLLKNIAIRPGCNVLVRVSRNDDPARASCPFDRAHSGLILSEGSTVLVLEALDRARERGATVYAEVLAHNSSIDGNELFESDCSGISGARSVQACLSQSGLTPADIDYVCANGNSLPSFDRKETAVLKRALGKVAKSIPVSSIKAVLGHPFGASPAFQIAAACLAIQQGEIPSTHNLRDPDPLCDLDFVPNISRVSKLRHVLVCSYGFGGINAFMILRAPKTLRDK